MRKIYEHIEYSRVGHFQAILEDAGIQTLVKNLGASGGAGEIPFTEVFPELWVADDADYERALELLTHYEPPDTETLTDWQCPGCGEDVEKEFGECWNCGATRPGFGEN
ncbi:MAG: DUF2007 domain-containing protein [Verrucomicrobiae bacterium]|nr:DUF2007 domain-containing protein [Verrucomicrobiae bacterium]MCP5541736.1 DUF2007 domain-containing protein [Akkermansiaceae bacterium]MCP5551737.1 DUF2007 domain-containing protein [Akkermansiaceae bacterium]